MTDASQKERAEVLLNNRRVNTMHGRAMLDLEQEQTGRFAKPSQVVAGEGAPTYPAAAPWTRTAVPDEPPLGFVNAIGPVGEQFEIEASLATQQQTSLPLSPGDASRIEASEAARHSPVGSAGASPSRRKLMIRPL